MLITEQVIVTEVLIFRRIFIKLILISENAESALCWDNIMRNPYSNLYIHCMLSICMTILK